MELDRSANGGVTYSAIFSGAVATSYPDTAVSPGTTYYYEESDNGTGGTSSPVSATTPPDPPSVSITSTSSTSIHVALGAASGTTSMQIDRNYTEIYLGSPVTTFNDTGLTPDTAYEYEVADINAGGGSPAGTASATTPPAAPTSATATTISASEIDLAFSNDSSATSVQIYRSANGGAYSQIYNSTPITSYPDTGLASGTTYSYKITDSDSDGPSDPTVVSAVTIPDAPYLSTATYNGSTVIHVWIASATGATAIQLYESTDDSTWTCIYCGGATGGTITIDDTGLTPDTTYYYKATNSNAGGTSAPSYYYNMTEPAAPTSVTATAVSTSEIDLTFTPDSLAEDVQIYRSIDGIHFTQIYAGSVTTSYPDTGLTTGTEYWYKITDSRPSVLGGSSDDSTIVNATTM